MIKLAITLASYDRDPVHKLREDESFEDVSTPANSIFKRTFASWDEAITWGLQLNHGLIIRYAKFGDYGLPESCLDCVAELKIYNGYVE